MTIRGSFISGVRRCPLAACAAALFAVAGPDAIAATVAVTSCADDGGAGTLRHAVLVANTGDTVDLSGLACSRITLQSGAISTGLKDLTVAGKGAGALTVDGNQADRVFSHVGTGTLTFSGVTIANGKRAAAQALGGCVYSKGNVTLIDAVVASCTAQGQTLAAGGGVLAYGTVDVVSSVISGNTAIAQAATSGSTAGEGGGVFAQGSMYLYDSQVSGNIVHGSAGRIYGGGVASSVMTVKYSTFTGNQATSAGAIPDIGGGGGVATSAHSLIVSSTIDHNTADAAGGIFVFSSTGYTATIRQTTISSNTGTLGLGGLVSQGDLSLQNCTIAFNLSGSTDNEAVGISNGTTVNAQSTIIADNSPVDIDAGASTVMGGDHNLIKIAGSHITVPPDTIVLDPALGPLAYNGGPNRTHALGAGSPAIDAGSNPASLSTDQRGKPYKRVVGTQIDIGAYELDADHIFGDGFAPHG